MQPSYFVDAKDCSVEVIVNNHKVQIFEPCQVDFWAPKQPVIYGLITEDNEVYVGATRQPQKRFRQHLHHPAHPALPSWAVRVVQGLPKYAGQGQTANYSTREFKEEVCRVVFGTRWFVLQTFPPNCPDQQIADGEQFWMQRLRPELNAIRHISAYSPKRTRTRTALPPNYIHVNALPQLDIQSAESSNEQEAA